MVDGLPRTAVIRRNASCTLKDGKRNRLQLWIREASFLTGGNKAIRYQQGIYLDLLLRFQEVLRNCLDVRIWVGRCRDQSPAGDVDGQSAKTKRSSPSEPEGDHRALDDHRQRV